jgi:hypothetical protein
MFGGVFFVFDLFLALVSALIAGLIIPLLAVVVETPVAAVRALFSSERWVEAAGGSSERLTWRTDAAHAAAVAEQVARQLELGYNRIEPHNAVFEGFGDS